MAEREFERLLQLLYTFEHQKAMALFDRLPRDDEAFWRVADALLLVGSNHQDPKLTVPHGLQTVEAAREMFTVAGPEASWGLLRFVTMYNFSIVKRDWTATYLEQQAATLGGDLDSLFWEAIASGQPDRAAALVCGIATQRGFEAAAHAVMTAALADLGRLYHNFTLAASYVEAGRSLGMPLALVPLANAGHYLGTTLASFRRFQPEPYESPPDGEASVAALQGALSDGEYDLVHDLVRRHAARPDAERAFEPLLIGVSKDPGFLGHNLTLAHSARLAVRSLRKEEISHMLWKFYRTLGRAYEYPQDLLVSPKSGGDPQAAITGLKGTLQHKTPPPLVTLSQCLSAGVPLEGVLKQIVGGYAAWRVGEKEHTIIFLNAAIQTASFLGIEKSLLPLTVALQQLPF